MIQQVNKIHDTSPNHKRGMGSRYGSVNNEMRVSGGSPSLFLGDKGGEEILTILVLNQWVGNQILIILVYSI